MNKLRKQIALVFVALFATVCVFSSCSEEESMIDAEREHKVQELLSVSKALAKKHEIGLCFTERMIRGGIDTLTVEDLEQAYEVYAANTVEFYVCTDSVMANENGLKLNRSSQMARETLLPGEGNTILATYRLGWEDVSRAKFYYDATLNLRVDWNDQGVVGTAVIFPDDFKIPSSVQYIHTFHNIVFDRDDFGDLIFSADTSFDIMYQDMYCYFVMYVEQHSFTQRMKLTMLNYNYNLSGTLTLEYNDQYITIHP